MVLRVSGIPMRLIPTVSTRMITDMKNMNLNWFWPEGLFTARMRCGCGMKARSTRQILSFGSVEALSATGEKVERLQPRKLASC